jgi:hypothetical protein
MCGLLENTTLRNKVYGFLDILQVFLTHHEPHDKLATSLVDWLDANFCKVKTKKSLKDVSSVFFTYLL